MPLDINEEPFEGADESNAVDATDESLLEPTELETQIRELSDLVSERLTNITIPDVVIPVEEPPTAEGKIATFDPEGKAPLPKAQLPETLKFPRAEALSSGDESNSMELAQRMFSMAMSPQPLPTAWPTLREQ